MLKAGWLKRQLTNASNDVKNWPEWMKREAGLKDMFEVEEKPPSSEHKVVECSDRKKEKK
jgi:hypothetical protein